MIHQIIKCISLPRSVHQIKEPFSIVKYAWQYGTMQPDIRQSHDEAMRSCTAPMQYRSTIRRDHVQLLNLCTSMQSAPFNIHPPPHLKTVRPRLNASKNSMIASIRSIILPVCGIGFCLDRRVLNFLLDVFTHDLCWRPRLLITCRDCGKILSP